MTHIQTQKMFYRFEVHLLKSSELISAIKQTITYVLERNQEIHY